VSLTKSFSQLVIIKGQLTDETSREYITGAQVILNGGMHQTITNTTGQYTFVNITPGTYQVTIQFIGYENDTLIVDCTNGENIALTQSLKPAAFQLETIQVTAEPEMQTESISAVDIQLRSITTSQDVLRMVPGLFIAQHAGGGKAEQIFLRGFDIDHGTDIAITTDNMPVNMVSHAHGQGYADLHYFIPETIDKVHFGKGPYHTHVGNLATAGYVGFQSLNILDENTLSFQFGQFNSYRGLAMLSLLKPSENNESQHAYIAGEYFTSDGYFDSPQDFKRISLFGKYNGSLGHGNYLSATMSTFSSQWDASGQIPLRAIESGMIGFFGAIDSTEGGKTSRSNVNLQLCSTFNQNSWIKNQVFYSKYDFELYSNFTFFLEDSIHGDQIKQKEDRNMFGYNGSYQRDDRFLNLNWQTELGLQYRQDLSNDNELSHTAHKTTTLKQLAYGDINESNIGVFLNETVRVSDWLSINAGLRFDHFTFSYEDQITGLTGVTVNDQIVSPKLNTYVKLSDNVQVFGSIGYGFHSNDTRVVISQPEVETLPRALGADIGTAWKPASRLLLTGTLWHLDLEQEFVYVGDAAVVEPSGRTRRMGVEFSGRWQVLDWLYADIDLNLTDAIAVDQPEGDNFIPLAPVFSSFGGLTVQTNNNWSGSIRYRTLGDRAANEDNSIIADGYTVIDALVTYRIKRYEFGINVDNVFDVRWREAQFDTESRLKDDPAPVSEIHFTAGTPFAFRAHVSYHF
jgi:outer membrane cobalamin receptor